MKAVQLFRRKSQRGHRGDGHLATARNHAGSPYDFAGVDRLIEDFRNDCAHLAGWEWGHMSKVEITITTPARRLPMPHPSGAGPRRVSRASPQHRLRFALGTLRRHTDKCLELLRHVARHEGLNIHQLAQALGRDYKNVHTDVKALEDLGLLEREDGKLKAPFDEIDIKVAQREAA